MKEVLALGVLFLLLFGCPQTPSTGANNMIGLGEKSTTFAVITNNSTSSSYALGGILSKHAISYNYTGNWTNRAANVSLFGSIDNSNFVYLTGVAAGNTTGMSFVVDKPVLYVQLVTTGWNASNGSATTQNLTVKYAGTT